MQCIPVGEDAPGLPGTVAVSGFGGPPLLIFTALWEEDGEGLTRGRVGWAYRSGLVLPEDGITSRDLEVAESLSFDVVTLSDLGSPWVRNGVVGERE